MSEKYKIASRLYKLLALPFSDDWFQEAVEMSGVTPKTVIFLVRLSSAQ